MKKNSVLLFFLLLILSLPTILPLFHSGFIQTDDGNWMVIRFSAFYETIKTGQFPVRFLGRLNSYYGYPVANFAYPGFMYLGTLIHLLKFSYIDTIKIMFGGSLLFSGLFTFLWLKKRFSILGAFLGGFVYVYNPYHLYDLYTRGSLGEMLALSVVPFILWQVERRSFFLSALGIGFLILSHNIMAYLFLPVIACYLFLRLDFQKLKKQDVIKNVFILIAGILLAAFFWFPAVSELHYTRFLNVRISEWQNYLANASLVGVYVFLIAFLAALFLLKAITVRRVIQGKMITFLFFLMVGLVLLTLPMSIVVWEKLPVHFIQFPFRLLSVVIVASAYISAWVVDAFKKKYVLLIVLLLMGVSILSTYPMITPKGYDFRDDNFYATNQATTTTRDEHMPVWVKKTPEQIYKEKVTIQKGEGKIHHLQYNASNVSFSLNMKKMSTVRINTLYYPGWQVFANKTLQKISYHNTYGVMEFTLPKGQYQVEAKFGETKSRMIADLVSLGTLVLLGILAIKKKITW